MRSMTLVAVVALLTAGMGFAATSVTYTIETGGNNHTYEWEAQASPQPLFSGGVSDGSTTVPQGQDLTWSVKVTAAGTTGALSKPIAGAANLVFDVELYQADGTTPVTGLGAAPLACSTGTPGASGAKACAPTAAGFWSSVNDGDTDNPNNPAATRLDLLANGAFAWSLIPPDYYQLSPNPNDGPVRIIDAGGGLDGSGNMQQPLGPNFDYGWFPTSNGRGGIDTDGSKPINTGVTTVESKIVGFGAGLKSYSLGTYYPGVAVDTFGEFADPGYGAGKALFEGQLNTKALPLGTYVLKVVPSADGNNIIHGDVVWDSTTAAYGGFGSFALKADSVSAPATVSFQVVPPPVVYGIQNRYVFYNQCGFDANNVAVLAAPVAGANNDDGDAVDTTKSPLIETAGADVSSFPNYTTFNRGLNGLVYDIIGSRNAVASDFTFQYYGRTGTSAPVTKTATAIVSWANTPVAGTTRTFIAFANNDVQDGWLKVTVNATDLGVPAEAHWWGSCRGEAKNNSANMVIDAGDLSKVKASYTSPLAAVVSWDWDSNKDRTCNSGDNSFTKSRFNVPPTTAVQKITK